MFNNEKGYTFPFVLMIIVLFSLFLTFQLQFYLSEKRVQQESITILKQEYYMHTAIRKIESKLQNNMQSIGAGQYLFQSGVVNYQIETYTAPLLKITISLKLQTLEENIGFAYYDKNQAKMIKWVEKN